MLLASPCALAEFHIASCTYALYWLPESIGIDLGSIFIEFFVEKEKRVLEREPFFFVMSSTPLAPAVPYMAVDAASFNTSIDSMSLGLRLSICAKSSCDAVLKSKESSTSVE